MVDFAVLPFISHLDLNASDKANEVDAKRAELEKANQDQRALAYMTTSFEALDQSFQAVTASLSLFANVWQDVLVFTESKIFSFY